MGSWRYKKKSKMFRIRKTSKVKKTSKVSDLVPKFVLDDIFIHLTEKIEESERAYLYNVKEDSVTGSLFTLLSSNGNQIELWSWSINFQLTHIRRKKTFNEKETGADGLISINIEHNGQIHTKSILFQAKNDDNKTRLNGQIHKMSKLMKGGNMIIKYTKDGFYGQTANRLNNEIQLNSPMKLDHYIKDVFFGCKSGQWGYNTYTSSGEIINLFCLDFNIQKKSK